MSTYATDVFNGDGSTDEFDLTFPFISRDHVGVTRIEKADGAETVLTVIETGTPVGDEYRWENDTRIKVGTAPSADQQIRIRRDTPENQQLVPWADGSYLISEDLNTSDLQWLYGLQELEDKFGLLQNNAIKYLGAVDLTVDAAPASPEGGDFYINSGLGTVVASWTGIAGDDVVGSEQVIYNQPLQEWQIFETPASQVGVVEVQGAAPIAVDSTDMQRPVVSIADATASVKGSMSAADKAKLDGIAPGATVGIPDAPSDGDQYARKDAAWSAIDIPPETIVSPTPPPNPIESQLWFDSTDGRTYVYYTDTDSSQWVESNPSWNGSIPDGSVTTPKLEDGAVTPDKLDRVYLEPGQEAITQLVAGSNVSLSPSDGKGVVTISSTGGGGGDATGVGADAWGNVASDGTISGGFNVASVSRTNPGVYQVTFTSSMPQTTYSVNITPNGTALSPQVITYQTTGFLLGISNSSGNATDSDFQFTVHASSTVTPTYTWTRDGTTLKTANIGDDVNVGDYIDSSDIAYANNEGTLISPAGGVFIKKWDGNVTSADSIFGYYKSNDPANPLIRMAGDGSADFSGPVKSGPNYDNVYLKAGQGDGTGGSKLTVSARPGPAVNDNVLEINTYPNSGTNKTQVFAVTYAGTVTAANVNFSLEDGQTLDVKDSIRRLQSALYRLKAAVLISDATGNDLRLRILEALETISEEEN